MEVSTDVDRESFLTGLPPFRCSTGSDTSPGLCIALSLNWGGILIALYSVILTYFFMACWQFLSTGVMILSHALDKEVKGPPGPSSPEKYRHIIRGICLVGFWNSSDPITAFFFLLDYLFQLGRVPPGAPHVRRPAIVMLMVIAIWWLGTNATNVAVPSRLVTAQVAPANAAKVYVPTPVGTALADVRRLESLRAPATLRSLLRAESTSAYDTRLFFNSHLSGGNSTQYFTYNYTVDANDMGLQGWPDLQHTVNGRCDVNSSWFSKNVPEEDLDVYRPWGLANKTVNVDYGAERRAPPSATAIPFPYAQPDFLIHQPAEHQYGIIVHSSHRDSLRPGTDPWYKTEPVTTPGNGTGTQIEGPSGNRVVSGRPALSCTQKDVWYYNGKQFKNIYELTDKANINFPDGWVTQLRMDFSNPRIIDMINTAGSSSLLSSRTFIGGQFDAGVSRIEKDMFRLLTATWFSSVGTFRNMLMVTDQQNITNAALNSDGKPQDGVGLFYVETPQVVAVRLSIIAVAPALLVFSILALRILEFCARRKSWYQKVLFCGSEYLFARTQESETFQKPEEYQEVLRQCAEKLKSNPSPAAGDK